MQFHNWQTWHSHVSSLADTEDGSSPGEGSSINGSADGSPVVGAMQQEYLVGVASEVSPVYGATAPGTSSFAATSVTSSPPTSTLIGSPHGLQFNLTWDPSVAHAPSGFAQAIIDAAEYYATLFSNQAVINLDVGYGEIAGSPIAPNALGESAPYGYLTDYPTVTAALTAAGFTFAAANEPTTGQFFITSAEAKALGLVNPVAGLDGYIGFSNLGGTGYSWHDAAGSLGSHGGIGQNQFDLLAVAEHEISEVMGRIGMQGDVIINNQPTYTPLDLFNYQSPGVLERSANGGYFSISNGWINLGNYNDAAVYGGDIADWASNTSIMQSNTLGLSRGSYDAYDAFTFPGVNGQVSLGDVIEDAALGYQLKPTANAALLGNYIAASGASAASGTTVAQDVQAINHQALLAVPHG